METDTTKTAEPDAQLLTAAEIGDAEAVQTLLGSGANPDARQPDTRTAFSPSGDRKTALMLAAERGHLAAVTLLLDRGAAVNARDAYRYDALRHAAFNGHLPVAERLLERGADGKDKALDTAAFKGYTEIVRLLLDYGANPNAHFNPDGDSAKKGDTPLLTAAKEGKLETVALLLERGADPDSRDERNTCVLVKAAQGYGRAEILRFLIGRGLCPSMEDRTQALHSATLYNDPEVLQILLDAGASLAGKRGVRMVEDSAWVGQPQSLRFFLDNGVRLTPRQAVRVLERACEQDRDYATRNEECLTLLQERVLFPLLAKPPSAAIVGDIRRIAEREGLDDLARRAAAAKTEK